MVVLKSGKNIDITGDINAYNLGAVRNKYGFIQIKNPYYRQDYSDNDDGIIHDCGSLYLLRKPTPAERREIVINTIIAGNGRPFKISKLANRLAVSDRTIQLLLKSLMNDGLIEIIKRYNKNGLQKSNSYRYIGEQCEFYGSGLTLNMLYDKDNKAGFRDWAWKDLTYKRNGKWTTPRDQIYVKAARNAMRKTYLESKGLPLAVNEKVRYFVIYFSFWRGKKEDIDKYDVDSEEDCPLLTKNGTIKIDLYSDKPYAFIASGNSWFVIYFNGNRNNPKMKLYDFWSDQKVSTFTYWQKNRVTAHRWIDDWCIEQLILTGDFTTK